MSSTNSKPIVMDIGSDSCKVGFAGDLSPKSVVSTGCGQTGHQEQATKKPHAGDGLKHLIDRGVVTDWAQMEIFLDHIFKNTLSTQSKEHPVLVTETPKNPKENREKMAEVLFEKFHVPSFFSSCQAVLCLYSAGRSTGLVLDIGAGVTTAVPVYEGYSLSESVVRRNFGGLDISNNLASLLSGRGYHLPSDTDKDHVREIKEKLCYVSQDYKHELEESSKGTKSANYQLPDGKTISIDKERFQCTELLFHPSIAGTTEQPGIHEMINKAICACELDTRKSLYTNIILSGGSSMFEGIVDRLKTELKPFGPLGAEARVSAPKDRPLSAWMGGSVLATLSSFDSNWITRKEYEESGPKILHSRCFEV